MQNNKFALSYQYFKISGRDEVDFLHANTHQIFLQVDTIDIGGHGQYCSKYPK